MVSVIKKILLIEDNIFIKQAYRDSLEIAGFMVTSAKNGDEGIAELKKQKFDIIILDLLMPQKNGFEFLDQKFKEKISPNIPIIIATNINQVVDLLDAKKKGVVSLITKSDITIKELIIEINKYI